MSEPPVLWYEAPAPRWLAALPVGNGRLGASVFGRVHKETVIVNEDTIWTRWPDDRNNPDALGALPRVRRLLLEGRTDEAHTLAELSMFGLPHRQASYQVLADMTLLFGGHHEELVSGYRRSLDLDDGIAAVEYELGGTRFRREVSERSRSTARPWHCARRYERKLPRSGSNTSGRFQSRRNTSCTISSAMVRSLSSRCASANTAPAWRRYASASACWS